MNGNKIILGSTDSPVREREIFFQLTHSFSSTIFHPSYFFLLFSDKSPQYLYCMFDEFGHVYKVKMFIKLFTHSRSFQKMSSILSEAIESITLSYNNTLRSIFAIEAYTKHKQEFIENSYLTITLIKRKLHLRLYIKRNKLFPQGAELH